MPKEKDRAPVGQSVAPPPPKSTLYCDICWGRPHKNGMTFQQCSECKVGVHHECYGTPNHSSSRNSTAKSDIQTFLCFACAAVGTTIEGIVIDRKYIETQKMVRTHARQSIRVEKRPTECCFCSLDDGSAYYHAMHPVYHREGIGGKHVVLLPDHNHKTYRLAWGHTLCCMALCSHSVTRGTVFGCTIDGTYDGDDVPSASYYNNDDDDDDSDRSLMSNDDYNNNNKRPASSSAATIAVRKQQLKDDRIHHFVFCMKLRPNDKETDWIKSVRHAQTKLKCLICGSHDEYSYRLAVQCSAHDADELPAFYNSHKSLHYDETCYAAMHVGCAMWGPNDAGELPNSRRVFFLPGVAVDDDTIVKYQPKTKKKPIYSEIVVHTYCALHAADLVKANVSGANILRYPAEFPIEKPIVMDVRLQATERRYHGHDDPRVRMKLTDPLPRQPTALRTAARNKPLDWEPPPGRVETGKPPSAVVRRASEPTRTLAMVAAHPAPVEFPRRAEAGKPPAREAVEPKRRVETGKLPARDPLEPKRRVDTEKPLARGALDPNRHVETVKPPARGVLDPKRRIATMKPPARLESEPPGHVEKGKILLLEKLPTRDGNRPVRKRDPPPPNDPTKAAPVVGRAAAVLTSSARPNKKQHIQGTNFRRILEQASAHRNSLLQPVPKKAPLLLVPPTKDSIHQGPTEEIEEDNEGPPVAMDDENPPVPMDDENVAVARSRDDTSDKDESVASAAVEPIRSPLEHRKVAPETVSPSGAKPVEERVMPPPVPATDVVTPESQMVQRIYEEILRQEREGQKHLDCIVQETKRQWNDEWHIRRKENGIAESFPEIWEKVLAYCLQAFPYYSWEGTDWTSGVAPVIRKSNGARAGGINVKLEALASFFDESPGYSLQWETIDVVDWDLITPAQEEYLL